MASALQRVVGSVAHGQQMGVGVQFIGAIDGLGSRISHGMFVTGATFGGDQIIVIAAFEQMRCLDKAKGASGEDVFDRTS